MKLGTHIGWVACHAVLWGGLLAGAAAAGAAPPAQTAQMQMKPGMKMEMATGGVFEGVGKVIALLPEKDQIVVGHEAIKGFMEAMPMGMGYGVEPASLLTGLKPGDRIRFKIDAGKKKIVAIERLGD